MSVTAHDARVNLRPSSALMWRACSIIVSSAGQSFTPEQDVNFTSLWWKKALTGQELFHLDGRSTRSMAAMSAKSTKAELVYIV